MGVLRTEIRSGGFDVVNVMRSLGSSEKVTVSYTRGQEWPWAVWVEKGHLMKGIC